MSLSSNIRAGRAYVEVTAETSKLQRNLTSAQAQLQNFGRTCTNVGKDLLMLSGAMAAPFVMAARSFAGFDDSMRLVQAVTQATDADFKALTKTAQRLGRDTSYTAQQAADAMVSLGRMGFSPTEIQASIDAVLNLARSTGTELAEAGDIAANSMRIFGIEASQMSDVADVLTVTANSSAQTLIDLFEALKMGGPQAAAAGESIRETSAAIAVLANMGIKGSLAGTALRKSFSQFAKVKVQDQLRSVGVETVDANGNLRKMAEIMRDIAKADPAWSVVNLRYFNPVGAHASGKIGEHPNGIPNNLMPYISQTAIGRRDHLNVFGNDYPTPDGTGVRDYIHVVDLAKGHVAAIRYLMSHTGESVFNLGTGHGYSVLDMVNAFETANGVKVPYVITECRPGDLPACYADPSKSLEVLGWKAERDLVDMCRDTWNWQKHNPNGYEK